MIKKIGVIGTGMLGKAICIRLLDLKFNLTVFNRTKSKLLELAKLGATIVNKPNEITNQDIILTIVRDAYAINDIAFGKNGIVERKFNDLTIADISTINPIESDKIAKKLARFNITMLNTPVMGGPNVALNGKLVMMVSGNKKKYKKYERFFKNIAEKVFYLGGGNTAQFIKLSMNIQIAFLAASISEGIVFAKGASIDPRLFLKVLNSTYFKTGMSMNKAYKMIENNFKATFTLSNLKKDLDTIIKTSNSLNINLPATKNIDKIYENAIKFGFGDLDYTGILAYHNKNNF